VRVRRPKPYVCVDCDYAEHFRFQETEDVEVAAGTWLRCLAHSRAQEQDGIGTRSWLRRVFAGRQFNRVEELVRVGLLRKRDDGRLRDLRVRPSQWDALPQSQPGRGGCCHA
jgi:hypothetical protein